MISLPRFPLFSMAATTAVVLSAPAVFAQADDDGDGAPHIAVAQEDTGELELEFEIGFGLDETTTPPTITLDTSVYDSSFPGYRTFPVNDTPSPNDDLGFVSEVEGSDTEGGAINGDIVVRLLSKDSNFTAFFANSEIFTSADPDFELGNQFDRHPIWVLANAEGDFTPATASFEVFDLNTGSIGGGATSLGQFDITLAVPEPASALLLVGVGGLALMRCRRGP